MRKKRSRSYSLKVNQPGNASPVFSAWWESAIWGVLVLNSVQSSRSICFVFPKKLGAVIVDRSLREWVWLECGVRKARC